MTQKKSKLFCTFLPIKRVSIKQFKNMYTLFSQYYENTDLETFLNDMNKKSGVFVLREKDTGHIVGFSTWTVMPLSFGKKPTMGIFSGDTILEKRYWGNKKLQQAFALRLVKMKLKHPGTRIFWLLISKGYKTYLLLANNFIRHFPNHQSRNTRLEQVIDLYCEQLFPQYYDKEKRLLDFGDSYQFLKGDVAEITEEMRGANARIRFFDDVNPTWRRGTELPCVGEVCMGTLLSFFHKQISGRSRQLPAA